jgi:hypothetical protein
MTKLISVRLTVPTGDDVTTERLALAVRAALEGLPADKGEAEDGKDLRIHWSAVDTVRIVERSAAPEKRMAPRKQPAGQGVLA